MPWNPMLRAAVESPGKNLNSICIKKEETKENHKVNH